MHRYLLVLILSCIVAPTGLLSAKEEVAPDIQQKLQRLYSVVDAKLREDSNRYRIANPTALAGKEIDVLKEPWIPKTYTIETDGGAWMQVWAGGFRLRSVLNSALNQLIDEKKVLQQTPEFSPDKAVDTAKAYLNRFQIPLSTDLELTTISFNRSYQACWEVRWTRVGGGILPHSRLGAAQNRLATRPCPIR
jgi:hypothetical protein